MPRGKIDSSMGPALESAWAILTVLVLSLAPGCGQPGAREDVAERKVPGSSSKTTTSRPAFMVCRASGRREHPGAGGKSREKIFKHLIRASKYALRSDNIAEGSSEVVRLDQKLFLKFDHRRRTYTRMTFGEYAKMVEGLRAYIARKIPKGATAEDRYRLEVMIGRRRPLVKVEQVPGFKEMLGRKCRLIRYYEDRQLRLEEWVAEGLCMPCDLAEVRALSGDFSRELLEKIAARKGLSLKSRVIGRLPGRPRLEERTVSSLSFPDKLSPEIFEIPAGYRKVSPPRAVSKPPEKDRAQTGKIN